MLCVNGIINPVAIFRECCYVVPNCRRPGHTQPGLPDTRVLEPNDFTSARRDLCFPQFRWRPLRTLRAQAQHSHTVLKAWENSTWAFMAK
ncbi:MAG: hypothetical protein QG621_40 [Patescibacteria group bacterium]|nr:hypothetical protein [Patescibacteria group bacterium]